MYGEGECCDLPTALQSWFCDPLEPFEATDVPRCVIIFLLGTALRCTYCMLTDSTDLSFTYRFIVYRVFHDFRA